MAFRRRFRTRSRRFKRRWDMQTFRECERDVSVGFLTAGSLGTCSNPLTFADTLLTQGTSTGTLQKPAASRTVTFGGCHLRIRLNGALINLITAPCSFNVKVVLAVVKLPMMADGLTPEYLPNLAITRSQSSVVHATQSDSDEDILWWHDEQLDLVNLACKGVNDTVACWDPFIPGGDCSCTEPINHCVDGFRNMNSAIIGQAAALYGRMTVDTTIRAKRRLKEREGLFLVQHYVHGGITNPVAFNWSVKRNCYLRFAVR